MDLATYLDSSPAHIGLLKFIFQSNPPKVILEVGACEGEDTLRYGKMFPDCKFFLFEPEPENAKLIRNRIQQNSFLNATLIEAAVGLEDGEGMLFGSSGRPETASRDDNWNYGNKSSSLLAPSSLMQKFHSWLKFERRSKVSVVTLKSFLENQGITRVDFLHMDVQGAELLAFKGAGELLDRISSIWVEVGVVPIYEGQPSAQETREFLESKGFILLLDSCGSDSGDHFYVNPKHFYVESAEC